MEFSFIRPYVSVPEIRGFQSSSICRLLNLTNLLIPKCGSLCIQIILFLQRPLIELTWNDPAALLINLKMILNWTLAVDQNVSKECEMF